MDYSVLLNKVHQHEFRGVINNWFSSYLRNQTQTTQVGSKNLPPPPKKTTATPYDVPQGSVLGKTQYSPVGIARVFLSWVFTRARQPLYLRSSTWKRIFVAASVVLIFLGNLLACIWKGKSQFLNCPQKWWCCCKCLRVDYWRQGRSRQW